MAEKTALWKSNIKYKAKKKVSEKYLEFDFLAVLAKTDDTRIAQGCEGCMKVHGYPMNSTLLHKYGYTEMLRKGVLKV